jgi:quinol-cytochrome oxidoreductase complex cytochrome b subunit
MITLPPGYKPPRGRMWIVGLLIAVLLAGHAVVLRGISSHLTRLGGLALALIFFVLAIDLGVLGAAQSALRRVIRKR